GQGGGTGETQSGLPDPRPCPLRAQTERVLAGADGQSWQLTRVSGASVHRIKAAYRGRRVQIGLTRDVRAYERKTGPVPISDYTRKLLWARSGNRCALCKRLLVEPGT